MSKAVVCEVCGREFSSKGIGTHRWKAHGEGRDHKPTPPGTPAWNKGLTKEDDPRLVAQGRSISATFRRKVAEGTYTPRRMGPEARARESLRMSQHNPGGRCSWFEVGEVQVQGTWERDLAQKMCDLGIPWKRLVAGGNRSWHYTDRNGKRRWYTPDFFLPQQGMQLEVKGYWWGDDKEKMGLVVEQNPKAHIVLVEYAQFEALLACQTQEEFLSLLDSTGILKPTP